MRDEARLGLGAVVVATLALGACVERGDDAGMTEDTTQATPMPATPEPVVSATFQPGDTATGTQVSGNADVYRGRLPGWSGGTAGTMTTRTGDTSAARAPGTDGQAAGDGFTLAVHLNGLTPGDHAWHIHSGPCGMEAPVVVPFTETPDDAGIDEPITVAQQGGMAMDTAFVPVDRLTLDALQRSPHSVHVHARGGVDHGPSIACAEFGTGASTTAR